MDSSKGSEYPFEKMDGKSGDDKFKPYITHRTIGTCLVQERHRFVKPKKEIGKKKNI